MTQLSHIELLRSISEATGKERAERLKELSELTQRLIDSTGRGLSLSEADLSNLRLDEVDLRRATLNRAVLHGTQLQRATLDEITMVCPGMERTNLSGASLRSAYVHALAAQTCNFDGADLSELRDATGTLFHGCSMRGVHLDGSHLAGSSFYQCDLSDASLSQANLQGSLINECLLDDAELLGCCCDQLTVTKTSLRGTSFQRASGRGLVLQRLTASDALNLTDAGLPELRLSDISGRDWRAAGLKAPHADLTDVTAPGADLTGAELSGARLLRCSLPDAALTGALLNNGKIVGGDLRRADLRGAHGENLSIVEADLTEANLTSFTGRCLTVRDGNLARVVLRFANLYRAMITGDPPRGMSLRGAVLEGATLVQAYLAADLRDADLSGANCAYSRFSQSDLSGARLDGTNMYQSTWVKVTLHGARVKGVRAPVFADRCPGLRSALSQAEGPDAAEFRTFLDSFDAALAAGRKGST
ncbi:pentapeptide repeat-containing protein [Streptomyces sp. MA5143a]|uniref:pentapeptide repeat-containing protein n=1 Tax=Streptomyces sp. MA5143a TaxID=2083010 RepID=UPI000D1C1851|nr:pentapeptide repeat-containing protein [Streptomyces sp. MA5143a]SPF07049.1 Type III effector pipB2 [Streptomyces sp. MA5143a]